MCHAGIWDTSSKIAIKAFHFAVDAVIPNIKFASNWKSSSCLYRYTPSRGVFDSTWICTQYVFLVQFSSFSSFWWKVNSNNSISLLRLFISLCILSSPSTTVFHKFFFLIILLLACLRAEVMINIGILHHILVLWSTDMHFSLAHHCLTPWHVSDMLRT